MRPMTKQKRLSPKRFNVYVVELEPVVLRIRKFRSENPNYVEGQACLYVGMTALEPEERLARHRSGWKSNSYVRRYGKWLRRRLYARYNPMTYREAQKREAQLADDLRRRGYAVWQR